MFDESIEYDNEKFLIDNSSFFSDKNATKFGTEAKTIYKDMSIIDYSENYNLPSLNNDSLDFGKQKEESQKTFLSKKIKINDLVYNNNDIIINEKDYLFKDNNSNKILENINVRNNICNKGINLIENEEEKVIGDNNKIKNNKKCGRKTKIEKINGKKGKHTKNNQDNIIRKIKSFFGKSLYLFIKRIFIIKTDLLKLEIDINKNLKKDFNLKLFNSTLKNIYMESKISEHYSIKKVETNEELIKKIYNENKEIEVIKILNLTYIEVFQIFRRNLVPINEELKKKIEGTNILNKEMFNDVEKFLEIIRLQERNKKENEEDIEKYINDIKSLVIGFEEWFNAKSGRER